MRWSKEDLVAQANFWITTVCRQQEVPGIQAKTLGKMGLRGVSNWYVQEGEGGVVAVLANWNAFFLRDAVAPRETPASQL